MVAATKGAGRLVVAVADRYRPAFARNFTAAMQAVARRITVEMVANAIDHPAALSTILQMVDAAPVVKDAHSDAIDAYAQIFSDAGKATLDGYAGALDPEALAEMLARLDVKSPFMQQAARDMSAKLVTRVNAETKRAIRQIILDATQNGASPYETSLLLQDVIGLNAGQAQAVRNYRNGLMEARDGTRGVGGLRSQWTLAPKIPASAALTPAEVRRFTDLYAQRQLEYRAYNIARTETMFASNMGQQLTWREMANQGFIDASTFTRVWSVVDDDRLCEECAPMDGQAVGLEENFVSDEIGVLESERKPRDVPLETLTPPLHPSCRCVLTTE